MDQFVQDDVNCRISAPLGIRAEEMVMKVYAALLNARNDGRYPEKILLSPDWYRSIQEYRSKLGSLEAPELDYLGKNSLFGLDIYIDTNQEFLVL